MVYFANLFVNLRDRLCDVARHVSAQSLDFLDLDEISSFLNWKRQYVSILKKVPLWMDTNYVAISTNNQSSIVNLHYRSYPCRTSHDRLESLSSAAFHALRFSGYPVGSHSEPDYTVSSH